MEIDVAAQNAQSGFSWQTLSATSMSTQADGNTTAIIFTDIQFSGRNSFNMSAVSAGVSLQCLRRGDDPPLQHQPSGGNSISYGGVAYPLMFAIERPFNPIPSPGDTHLGRNLNGLMCRFS